MYRYYRLRDKMGFTAEKFETKNKELIKNSALLPSHRKSSKILTFYTDFQHDGANKRCHVTIYNIFLANYKHTLPV